MIAAVQGFAYGPARRPEGGLLRARREPQGVSLFPRYTSLVPLAARCDGP